MIFGETARAWGGLSGLVLLGLATLDLG
jgi:hypothetical protein